MWYEGRVNGRAYDPEIAAVIVQAVLDGHYTYDRAVKVVRAQAKARADAVRAAGGSDAEIEAERRRWASFGKSSITRWKQLHADFERDLMDAEEQVAREHVEGVVRHSRKAMKIAKDTKLEPVERRLQLFAFKTELAARMWAITRRLDVRRTYHDQTPAARGLTLPTLPENPRFDRVARPDRDESVN